MARWVDVRMSATSFSSMFSSYPLRTKARSVGIYIEKKNASNVIYFLNDYLKETKLI